MPEMGGEGMGFAVEVGVLREEGRLVDKVSITLSIRRGGGLVLYKLVANRGNGGDVLTRVAHELFGVEVGFKGRTSKAPVFLVTTLSHPSGATKKALTDSPSK
jgi:hypothetical protein